MPVQLIKWVGPTVPTLEEAEAKLSIEGYKSFQWYDVPGVDYPNHSHEYDECLWVLKGELILNIDGIQYNLQPGDRLYLPARIHHTAQVPKKRSVTYLVGQKPPAAKTS